jgi:hypothetical protein
MNLKELHATWEEDCKIDKMRLDETSLNTPILHAKYLKLLAEAKLSFKRVDNDHNLLMKDKWLWYNGKLSQEEIAAKGWNPDPFDGLKVLKGEMEHYYNSDPEIQASQDRLTYYRTVIETLSEIISSLNWRHQNIKNIIEWRKFESGG